MLFRSQELIYIHIQLSKQQAQHTQCLLLKRNSSEGIMPTIVTRGMASARAFGFAALGASTSNNWMLSIFNNSVVTEPFGSIELNSSNQYVMLNRYNSTYTDISVISSAGSILNSYRYSSALPSPLLTRCFYDKTNNFFYFGARVGTYFAGVAKISSSYGGVTWVKDRKSTRLNSSH